MIRGNWIYQNLIPDRYKKKSGVLDYEFGVFEPWWQTYKYALTIDDKIIAITPSAYCFVRIENSHIPMAIDSIHNPKLAEAILLTGKVLLTSNRIEKYLTLYKAHECLVPRPAIEFAAIRHSLAHASSILERPKTIATLKQIFGTTKVDLNKHRHTRLFYLTFGGLLTANDKTLYKTLCESLDEYRIDLKYKSLLPDWRVRRVQ